MKKLIFILIFFLYCSSSDNPEFQTKISVEYLGEYYVFVTNQLGNESKVAVLWGEYHSEWTEEYLGEYIDKFNNIEIKAIKIY